MASSLDFVQYVCDQIEGTGIVRARKMFGDWLVYVDEKPLILVCDNICYIKKLPELEPLMADAECGCPYDGAKEHYILDIDHASEVRKVVGIALNVIPLPQKKARKKTSRTDKVFFGEDEIRCNKQIPQSGETGK